MSVTLLKVKAFDQSISRDFGGSTRATHRTNAKAKTYGRPNHWTFHPHTR